LVSGARSVAWAERLLLAVHLAEDLAPQRVPQRNQQVVVV
jgi:hypothetical protein